MRRAPLGLRRYGVDASFMSLLLRECGIHTKRAWCGRCASDWSSFEFSTVPRHGGKLTGSPDPRPHDLHWTHMAQPEGQVSDRSRSISAIPN
jgi:hypothetical protein